MKKQTLSTRRKHTAFRFDPDFLEAIRRLAEAETDREGVKVSQATALMTSALNGNSELRKTYKQLKKERNNAIREREKRIREEVLNA